MVVLVLFTDLKAYGPPDFAFRFLICQLPEVNYAPHSHHSQTFLVRKLNGVLWKSPTYPFWHLSCHNRMQVINCTKQWFHFIHTKLPWNEKVVDAKCDILWPTAKLQSLKYHWEDLGSLGNTMKRYGKKRYLHHFTSAPASPLASKLPTGATKWLFTSQSPRVNLPQYCHMDTGHF